MEQEITSLSIINEPGQNVNTFSEKVLDLAGQIEGGSEYPPHDISLTVCNTFLSTSEDTFKHEVLRVHNIVEKDPTSMSYDDVIQTFKDKYDSLVVQELYQAASDRNHNKDNDLAAMNATIK